MNEVLHWAEQHPWLAGGATLGAVFLLLWLFGFFGSSSSSNAGSGNNLAAAYYAAEAAQTTAGTQLQMATVAYGAQTAQTQIKATAAQGIASTQAGMYTTLGQQQAGVAINNANDALSASNTAAMYANSTATAGYNAQIATDYINSIIAPQIARTGGTGRFYIPTSTGGQYYSGVDTGGSPNINSLLQLGFTPYGAEAILGLPAGSTPGG